MAAGALEKRGEERVAAVLPVALNELIGLTRNVSATGVFFETDASFAPASPIRFVVEIVASGRKRTLKCQGNVVRVETHDSRLGVAVKILESTLETAAH